MPTNNDSNTSYNEDEVITPGFTSDDEDKNDEDKNRNIPGNLNRYVKQEVSNVKTQGNEVSTLDKEIENSFGNIPAEIYEHIPEKLRDELLNDIQIRFKLTTLDEKTKNSILNTPSKIFEYHPNLLKSMIRTARVPKPLYGRRGAQVIANLNLSNNIKQAKRTNERKQGFFARVWSRVKSIFSSCKPTSLEDLRVDTKEVVLS